MQLKVKMIRVISAVVLVPSFLFTISIKAQNGPLAPRAADTVIAIWKEYPGATPDRPGRWSYEQGVVLKGMERAWKQTGNQKYLDYIRQTMDRYVADDGTIRTYRPEEYNLDNILLGRMLLFL